MGCVCCSLGSFVSVLLDALERISLCTVCAMLVCCLLFTIIAVMVLGIGIGFHYCFVQNSVDAMAKAAKAAGALRSSGDGKGNVLRSVDKAMLRGFAHRLGRRDVASPPLTNENNNNYTTFESLAWTNSTDHNVTNFNNSIITDITNYTMYQNLALPNMEDRNVTDFPGKSIFGRLFPNITLFNFIGF